MWIIAILYIVFIILAITIYFIACNRFGKYEERNDLTEYKKAINLFKVSFITLILGFSFLTIGLILRIGN